LGHGDAEEVEGNNITLLGSRRSVLDHGNGWARVGS
jgi:hypothetical protein